MIVNLCIIILTSALESRTANHLSQHSLHVDDKKIDHNHKNNKNEHVDDVLNEINKIHASYQAEHKNHNHPVSDTHDIHLHKRQKVKRAVDDLSTDFSSLLQRENLFDFNGNYQFTIPARGDPLVRYTDLLEDDKLEPPQKVHVIDPLWNPDGPNKNTKEAQEELIRSSMEAKMDDFQIHSPPGDTTAASEQQKHMNPIADPDFDKSSVVHDEPKSSDSNLGLFSQGEVGLLKRGLETGDDSVSEKMIPAIGKRLAVTACGPTESEENCAKIYQLFAPSEGDKSLVGNRVVSWVELMEGQLMNSFYKSMNGKMDHVHKNKKKIAVLLHAWNFDIFGRLYALQLLMLTIILFIFTAMAFTAFRLRLFGPKSTPIPVVHTLPGLYDPLSLGLFGEEFMAPPQQSKSNIFFNSFFGTYNSYALQFVRVPPIGDLFDEDYGEDDDEQSRSMIRNGRIEYAKTIYKVERYSRVISFILIIIWLSILQRFIELGIFIYIFLDHALIAMSIGQKELSEELTPENGEWNKLFGAPAISSKMRIPIKTRAFTRRQRGQRQKDNNTTSNTQPSTINEVEGEKNDENESTDKKTIKKEDTLPDNGWYIMVYITAYACAIWCLLWPSCIGPLVSYEPYPIYSSSHDISRTMHIMGTDPTDTTRFCALLMDLLFFALAAERAATTVVLCAISNWGLQSSDKELVRIRWSVLYQSFILTYIQSLLYPTLSILFMMFGSYTTAFLFFWFSCRTILPSCWLIISLTQASFTGFPSKILSRSAVGLQILFFTGNIGYLVYAMV